MVSIYIALRFQWRMAVGGMIALLHDLVVAAGIYSLVGFEVTPSTIVGLLTILGFSLYDTVVVYDKVGENAKDILAGSRTTFTDAANKAVNQTLMRSINTSLIALLPVAGLLFVGAGILGVGTIKDLALILFVGLASGAYSSLFLATPIVVELTEREPAYKALTKRVVAKRASDAKRAEEAELTGVTAAPRPPRRRSGAGPEGRRPPRAPPAALTACDRASRRGASTACCATSPDFPTPGVLFKDITPLLADGAGLRRRGRRARRGGRGRPRRRGRGARLPGRRRHRHGPLGRRRPGPQGGQAAAADAAPHLRPRVRQRRDRGAGRRARGQAGAARRRRARHRRHAARRRRAARRPPGPRSWRWR